MKKDSIILAPAGARAQVEAAVRCGADAVYLGAKHFNARRRAENFDDLSLPDTVAYCHGRGVKVFVTVNTLVMDAERALLEEEAALVAQSGADAVIIQDPAVMRLFRSRYPALPRHASTQTVVHDLEGAKLLEEEGYDTVLLARELTLSEMEKICAGISVRAEAFVHGAHCMSVSGACYLSGMLGGRSGNRGLCAQPCRLDWRCGGREHALSLKDMSLLGHIRDMESAGVGTFKIEGRMKRPEYVAAVVTACRLALAGEPYDEDSLRAVFSRSGFTDGFLTGRRDAAMFGSRTREDVTGAERVLKSLSALYREERPRVAVDMGFTGDDGGSSLCVTDGRHTVQVAGPVPESAVSRPLDEALLRRCLLRTGGTPFTVERFRAELAPGLSLSAAALNALRREALDDLLTRRGETRPWAESPYVCPPPERRDGSREPALWARFPNARSLPEDTEAYEKLLLPVEELSPGLLEKYGARLAGELPALLWPEDEAVFARRLKALRDAGLGEVMTDNLYGVRLGARLGLGVLGGAGLNVLNTETLRYYEEKGLLGVTASFELPMARLKALGGTVPLGALAYGRLPLMRFRVCPVRAGTGCAACGGQGSLTDRLGLVFPVECARKKYVTLLNSVPLHIAERDLRGLDYLLLYFTTEERGEVQRVTRDFLLRRKSEVPRTGGLYYRELL